MICIFWFDCSMGYCGPLKPSYSDFISHMDMVVCGGEDQIQYNCDVVEEEARVGLWCTVFVSLWHMFIYYYSSHERGPIFIHCFGLVSKIPKMGWWSTFHGGERYIRVDFFVFEISMIIIIGVGHPLLGWVPLSWSNLDPGSKLYLTLKKES